MRLEKAIKQIDDKFGPGTVFPASDLPENKPAEVEQTEQFNRFNRMYEDGGRVNQQDWRQKSYATINPLGETTF